MARQIINNSESGLIVRDKLNSNFLELYTGKDAVTVNTYADLPDPTTVSGQRYWVLTSTGVFLVNRRSKGAYYSDGVVWTYLGDFPTTADQLGNVPAGGISATDVQAALNELDTDKEVAGAAAAAIAAHVAELDPHVQYALEADLAETIDDRVAALLVAGTNITLTYDDPAGTLTIDAAGGGASDYFLYQDAQRSLTNTVALQQLFNQTTNGAFTPPSLGLYEVHGTFIVVGMSATTGNAQFNLLGAGTAVLAGQMMQFIGVDNNSSVASTTRTGSGARGTNTSATLVVSTGTGTEMLVQFKGQFKVTTLGTIIPSIALTTATAAILSAGSHIVFKKLADDAVYASPEFS